MMNTNTYTHFLVNLRFSVNLCRESKSDSLYQLEICSTERICRIAVLYNVAFKFNVNSFLRNAVGQQRYKFYHNAILSPFWVT